MTLGDVDGIAKGHFLCPGAKKGHPNTSAPTLPVYHTLENKSTWNVRENEDSMFYTISAGVICLKSRLEKKLETWYPDGTKKGDTRYGNAPAGRAFPSSVLHKCQSQCKQKNMNAAEEIPTKPQKPG